MAADGSAAQARDNSIVAIASNAIAPEAFIRV
jgi:hypothetical protein